MSHYQLRQVQIRRWAILEDTFNFVGDAVSASVCSGKKAKFEPKQETHCKEHSEFVAKALIARSSHTGDVSDLPYLDGFCGSLDELKTAGELKTLMTCQKLKLPICPKKTMNRRTKRTEG